uniref:PHD-type domain-containing protein n=1 Tax=Esox lucius TaxID=8010 RepID=A0A6Q2YRU0_ESOLU
MEPQPRESDDLQPQDLSSTCSHAAMDLTRKGEECLLKTSSVDAIRVVKPSSWYPGSGGSKGLPFPNTDPEHRLQPGDQIQPDNAFSNTTVTLSYVSRSHVFSTHDTLSQHSTLYGVPSISKFSTLDGYLQQVDRPLGLVPQSEMFDSVSPAAPVVVESVAAVPLMQHTHEINGSRMATSGGVEKHKPQQRGNSKENCIFQVTDNNRGLQNGRSDNWPNSAICIDSSPELLTTDLEEKEQRSADTEVLFLISRTEEPVILQDSRSPRDLCSTSREYISSLQDPVSPSATSLDNADLFILPQASCSLSAVNSFADKTADTHWDDLASRGPQLSGLSGEGTVQGTQANSDNTSRSDISKDYQQPIHNTKAVSEPVVDLTEDESIVPQVVENKPKESVTSNQNGKAKAEQRTFERKKLPPRSGRGTRLEAIVMNINPNWYKVSTKKPKVSKTQIQPLTNSQNQTQSSPSEAAVSQTQTQSSPSEAAFSQTQTQSSPSEAAFSQTQTQSSPSEAAVSRTQTQSSPSEAAVSRTQTQSSPSEAAVSRTQTPSSPSEAAVSQTQTQSSPSEAAVSRTQTQSSPSEAAVSRSQTQSCPSEASVSRTQTPSSPSEASVSRTPTPSSPSEASVSRTPTPSSPSEASVSRTQTWSSPSEASVSRTQTRSSPSEAVVSRTQTRSSPSEAAVSQTQTRSSPSEAVVSRTQTRSSPSEAAVSQTQTRSSPSEAAVSRTQTQSSPSEAAVSPNQQISSASSSEGETKVKPAKGKAVVASTKCSIDSINIHIDSGRESTSESEHAVFFKYPDSSTSPKASSPSFLPDKHIENEYELRGSSSEVDVVSLLPPSKVSERSPGKQKAKNTSCKAAFPITKTTKVTPAPKKKRKKPRPCQSSIFSPQEPEIKLKYINYKEEKRDVRGETFSPFIHVERKSASTSPANCTVINYPEEEKPRQKGQRQMQAAGSASGSFIPGAIPSTSCLQLGRVSTHSKYCNTLVCCLCGGSANALDLGDLHGPYYPEGYRPSSKAPASTPGLKEEEEEDFSDSDSSCSLRGRGRKYARPPGVPWPHKPGPRLNQEGLLGRWTSDSAPSGSPPAKRARTQAGVGVTSGAVAALEDWYSPPVVPLEQCEYWLHEDCCIWAAGVFLVKGRVYGLEEAVKVAQETMCLRCHKTGATLGCFLKGCPNKYHYRCCLQSGKSPLQSPWKGWRETCLLSVMGG